jgi:hypothetical protein
LLDSQISALVTAGDLDPVLALRKYRGELLIGRITAEQLPTEGADAFSTQLNKPAKVLGSTLTESRSKLAAAYAPAIKAALASNDVDAAERLKRESERSQEWLIRTLRHGG